MRLVYLAVGLLCVGIATVDLFIPGAPSTVFVLISLWCFKRSSPRLEDWLLNRSVFAPALQDWERDRSMTRRNKVLALSMLWLGIGASIAYLALRHKSPYVMAILAACAVGVTIFLLRIKVAGETPLPSGGEGQG